jgi:hypothetical protein
MRIVRFGAVSVLGWIYGRRILAALESNIFKGIMALFIALTIVATAYTTYRVIVTTRSRRQWQTSSATKDAA